MTLASDVRADPIAMQEKPGHVTTATVVVDASPAEIYAAVTDYVHWPTLFSDVRAAKVEGGGVRDARVRFTSHVLEHEVVVKFDNIPDQQIRYIGIEGPRGGRASGSYVFEPIEGGKRTKVTATMYLDVVGVIGAFVSDNKTKSMREGKLKADINDVVHHFAAAHGADSRSRSAQR